MKKRVLYPILAVALVLAMGVPVGMHMATPVMAATVTFTGDVTVDFVGPGILVIPDPGGVGDVGLPGIAPPGTISGWDMEDLRLTYDSATDTLYVGINTPRIAGDADGDGNPGGTSNWLATNDGTDLPDLGGTETIAVYFDLNQDGTFDVIAGVGGTTDITGFTVAQFDGSPFNPALAFGAALPANTGSYYANPSAAAPHFEFTILDFSTLPGQDAMLGSFRVWAFMGSLHDDGIGEDYIQYQQSPNTMVTIVSSAPEVVSGGSVNLTITESNTGSVNLTDVRVEVTKNGELLATLDETTPGWSSSGNMDNVLDPGETWSWAISSGAITATTQFVATGSGVAPGDFLVTYPDYSSERDEVTVNATNPGIDLEKYVWDGTNWHDADAPATGPNLADTVNPVVFRFVITNIGNADLTSVNLTDTDISAFFTDQGLTNPAIFPLASLTVNATATFYGSLPWSAGQHSNTATVTGTPPVGPDVSDSDPAHYFGSQPSIDLEKHVWDGTSWHDADAATGPYLSGSVNPVIFRFIITNDGGGQLTSVNLTDTDISAFFTDQGLINPAIFPIASLAENDSVTVYGKVAWQPGQHSNTAIAIGTPPVGPNVTASDPAHYFGSEPPPPIVVGWQGEPVSRLAVLSPLIGLLAAIVAAASLLVLRRRRCQG